jgi:integrase
VVLPDRRGLGPRRLDAGPFAADVASFRLHLAAENKAAGTIRIYTCRPQLWLAAGNRGPMTASGIYQMITRRGRECGIGVFPHRFRHHFSHTWLDRGGPEGDLMELNGWSSPQMLRRYGASARSARARRTYDRIMDDSP